MRREITEFQHGVINKIEEQSIPAGAASNSLNFLTKGDHFELRRGSIILGTEIENADPCRGLHVARQSNGTEHIFRKRGRKLEHYNTTTEVFDEVGTDMFPAVAEDDEAAFVDYQSLAGDAMFVSSVNSSIYKIMLANPTDYADMVSTDYRGFIFASQNRIFMVQKKDANGVQDKTGVYTSFIDAQNYTTVSSENVGTGVPAQFTYTDTLAFKAGGAKRTCFGIVVTGSTETFRDNGDGTLTGTAGGTGTINYMTGAISVTFITEPVGAILADYQWEDSTNGGIADFSFTTPTREPGEGDVFRQDDGGGKAQAVESYEDVEYCFHERKTWALTLSADDTNATNLPYRKQVGIPSWKARVATGDGIYYVDDTDENDPKIRVLTLSYSSDNVIPKSISDKLDLSGYRFDDAWMERWGSIILVGCRTSDSTVNNRIILYDTVWESFDIVDFFSSFGKIFEGTLILGDSLSPNVYQAFSGFDDEDASVGGFFETSQWDLDEPNRQKKAKKVQIEGLIQTGQIIGVYGSADRGGYTLLGYIRGDGDYVDAQSVTIGSETIGRSEIGGGSAATAFHYLRELKCSIGKFSVEKLKFQVESDEDGNEGLGYFSVSSIAFDDVRLKQEKVARKYRISR